MKTTEFNMSFVIHDIKNYIGVAISSLQLALVEHTSLEDNIDVTTSIDALWAALNSTREISANLETNSPDKSSLEFVITNVNEHVTASTKPYIDSLRKIYPKIDI
ncbi:MAG TPA: hypothetical protein VJ981_04545, partial [Gammaproteobacteria bacterium]|nr:hypothetical protein [Gammaproteobacteria bacterium]